MTGMVEESAIPKCELLAIGDKTQFPDELTGVVGVCVSQAERQRS